MEEKGRRGGRRAEGLEERGRRWEEDRDGDATMVAGLELGIWGKGRKKGLFGSGVISSYTKIRMNI